MYKCQHDITTADPKWTAHQHPVSKAGNLYLVFPYIGYY